MGGRDRYRRRGGCQDTPGPGPVPAAGLGVGSSLGEVRATTALTPMLHLGSVGEGADALHLNLRVGEDVTQGRMRRRSAGCVARGARFRSRRGRTGPHSRRTGAEQVEEDAEPAQDDLIEAGDHGRAMAAARSPLPHSTTGPPTGSSISRVKPVSSGSTWSLAAAPCATAACAAYRVVRRTAL